MAADEQTWSRLFGSADEIFDPAVTNVVLRDGLLEYEAMPVSRVVGDSKKRAEIV